MADIEKIVSEKTLERFLYEHPNPIAEHLLREYQAKHVPPKAAQPVSVGEALEKIAKAEAKVSALCSGDEKWIMSIPARLEHDPDIVISSALHSAKAALTAIHEGTGHD